MSVVAIMGGSYNPVHIGHLMVAQFVAQWCEEVEKVVLMLSPLNPLKAGGEAPASDSDRLEMLHIAVQSGGGRIGVSDIELSMPRPSYTIDTLRRLSAANTDVHYKLVIGSDNWNVFHKWRCADEIIDRFGLIVYPRPGYVPRSVPDGLVGKVTIIEAPVADISSTWIRRALSQERRVNYFLPPGVYEYIKSHGLYRRPDKQSKQYSL